MSNLLNTILYVLPSTSTIVLVLRKNKLSRSQKKFLKIILLTSSVIVIIKKKKYLVASIQFAFSKIKSLLVKSDNLKSNVQDLGIGSSTQKLWITPVVGIVLLLLGIYGKHKYDDYLLHQYINELLEQLTDQDIPAPAYPAQGF